MIVVKKRYVFVFEGFGKIRRLDSLRERKGWNLLEFPKGFAYNGYGCGLFPISSQNNDENTHQIYVCTGYAHNREDRILSTSLFTTNFSDFGKSTLAPLYKSKAPVNVLHEDGFPSNMFFHISTTALPHIKEPLPPYTKSLRGPPSNLIAIVGEKALHIFDETNLTWLSGDTSLGEE